MRRRGSDEADPRLREVAEVWRCSGHSALTIRQYGWWVTRYLVHCARRGLDHDAELNADGVARFARRYCGPRKRGRVGSAARASARAALRAWWWGLRNRGYRVPEWKRAATAPPLPPLLHAYQEYRVRHCGVAESTLSQELVIAGHFLAWLTSRSQPVRSIHVLDIDEFVAKLSKCVGRRTVARGCTSLRAFLRFLRATGRLRRDLAGCVVAPRVRPMAQPPRALPWADVRRLLHAARRGDHPPGRRDFAVLLLMASYGMGASEVCALRLDDIDWRGRMIVVRRPKTGRETQLPLLGSVARAVSEYLRFGRPPHARTRKVFVARPLPHLPLSGSAIRFFIRKHARTAGINLPLLGGHVIRHSFACRQVDWGAPPKVLGDILGHGHPSSTSVYIRVATTRLRAVGLPVPR